MGSFIHQIACTNSLVDYRGIFETMGAGEEA